MDTTRCKAFFYAFDIQNVDEETPTIDRLVHIIDQVSAENIECNDKLMDFLARRTETKVMEKVFIIIAE